MTYDEALNRLRNHSNLAPGPDEDGLLYVVWKTHHWGTPLDLSALVEDILQCLAVVNVELNGPHPSDAFERHNPSVIPDVASAVSGLVVALLQYHRRWSAAKRFPADLLDQVRDDALRIAMGWDMVLAGDHDDLTEDLNIG